MKKFLALLLIAMVLLQGLPFAQADDEVSIYHFLTEQPPEATSPADAAETTPEPTGEDGGEAVMLLPDGSVELIISAVGDITFGGDVRKRSSIFERELARHGGDRSFVMRNVRDILSADDITIGNLETTLTTAPVYKTNNQFVFSAPREYVDILLDGSIEAVTFENNHAMDHGADGHRDTIETLEEAGIIWSTAEHIGVIDIKGIRVAHLAYQTFDRYPELFDTVPAAVSAAKKAYDLVIVSFHWGKELDYYPNKNQQTMAKMTIDAGADLVLGHHSHRINPIEEYKGKYIVYSLANFSFSGNNKPDDMSSFIFQIKYNIKEGEVMSSAFRIIPIRISSKTDYNDFTPTPHTEQRYIDSIINTLHKNGKYLENPVATYPVDWE